MMFRLVLLSLFVFTGGIGETGEPNAQAKTIVITIPANIASSPALCL